METVWRPGFPLDLLRTLGPLRHGLHDPTWHVERGGAVWRGSSTPEGPVTYRLGQQGGEITCSAWGPGSTWLVDGLPYLLGSGNDLEGFEPRHPVLEQALLAHPGIRIPRTRLVLESLVPAVLEQKVTGKEAFAAYAWLVRRYGEPAPGPVPATLRVPPGPEVWRRIPSWDWHRAGVDPRRMRTVLAAMPLAGRLEEALDLDREAALDRLRAVPGVGEWTANEVAVRALGDTDALSVGDYHLAGAVGWALVGRPVDDEEMVALLEPWRPYRALVVRLLETAGPAKPRFGPRATVQDHRRH